LVGDAYRLRCRIPVCCAFRLGGNPKDYFYSVNETQRDDEDTDIYAWEWQYDLAGNRTYQDFNGEKTYYTYDNCKQLTHEITDGVPTYYQYDGCGNQTAKQEGAGTTYFQYDHENLMTQIDFPDASHNYFSYDADGKRTSIGDSEGYRKLIYQGPDMLALMQERDASNDPIAQYTMGLGLESMRRGGEGDLDNGSTSFFHYDALGSTQELTNAGENVTATYRYNAWGQILVHTGTTTNPHTYGGRARYYEVPTVQFHLLGLRFYDPALGRFVTTDLIITVNPYVYGTSRPAAMMDPSGLRATAADYLPRYPSPPHPLPPWPHIRRVLAAHEATYGKEWPGLDDIGLIQASNERMAGAIYHGYWDAYFAHEYWRSCSGGVRFFDLAKLLREVPRVQVEFLEEAMAAREAAKIVGPGHYWLISKLRGTEVGLASLDDNWNFALGGYDIQGVAEVCHGTSGVTMNFTLWRIDRYEFDQTGFGHLHTVGWAKNYYNVSKETRTLHWPVR